MEFLSHQNPSFPSIETPNPAGAPSGRGPEWQQQQQPPPPPPPQYFSSPGETGLEDAMWRMALRQQDVVETPYPERPGEPDCAYYMRMGLCGFGVNCKFNHPPKHQLVSTMARSRGEYPQRVGQPDCQYYMKTGTCKYGLTCKYHHPIEKLAGAAQLNALNLPLRPGEKDCAYYMRTGHCKYGTMCKFNHPQLMLPLPVAIPGPSASAPAAQPYPTSVPGWGIARPHYLSPPRLPGPSNFPPVILPSPQGVVPVPTWNPYQAPLPVPEGTYVYGPPLPLQEPVTMDMFSPFMPSSSSFRLPTPPSPSISGPQEGFYPERPGQPDCQYYMKTGECRFGSQCKFHHPPNRNISRQASALSPMGLPLRPGAPPCTFYSRFGYCKFGPTCKFDHPFVPSAYPPVMSGVPVSPYLVGQTALPPPYVPTSSGISMEQSSSRQDNTGSVQITQQHDIHGSS